MNIVINVLIAILVFLAVSSGITKILLMPQEIDFFGAYGFSNPLLIAYGISQVVGGILLIFPKTRIYGAIVVAITFIISLIVLVIAEKLLVAGFTAIATALLGFIGVKSTST